VFSYKREIDSRLEVLMAMEIEFMVFCVVAPCSVMV
jgi:hypothetical protein